MYGESKTVIIVAFAIGSWRLFNPLLGQDTFPSVLSSPGKRVAFTLGTHSDITTRVCIHDSAAK